MGIFFREDITSVREAGIYCRAGIAQELAAGRNVRNAVADDAKAFITGRRGRLDAGDGTIFG